MFIGRRYGGKGKGGRKAERKTLVRELAYGVPPPLGPMRGHRGFVFDDPFANVDGFNTRMITNPFTGGALVTGRGGPAGDRLQLTMDSVKLPDKPMAFFKDIVEKWPKDAYKGFAASDVFDTSYDSTTNLSDPKVKDKFLAFNDDVSSNYWSQMLSPMHGPILLYVPREATYKSPMHYVSGMQILSSSTPGMLFGGVAQAVFNGGLPTDTCDLARAELGYTLRGDFAESVILRASQCDTKKSGEDFWKIDSLPCHYYTSMWLALYYKHLYGGSTRKSPLAALTSTGKKFLIYNHSQDSTMYSVSSFSWDGGRAGYNMVGLMLMIIRTMARNGLLVERNAGPAWVKIAKPIVEQYSIALSKANGEPEPEIEAEQ